MSVESLLIHQTCGIGANARDKLLLVQSLENELRLLEHEHRDTEITATKSRLAQLERL